MQVWLTLLIAALVTLCWLSVLDRATQRQVESATTQALVAFAAARGLNAGISVLQSTEVGVGVTTHPFEALDPFNDLVEDYSSIMKLAIGSLIGQTLLLEISSSLVFKLALTLSAAIFLVCLWWRPDAASRAWKLFASVALVRFLVLLALLVNIMIDQAFLDEPTEQNMTEVRVLASDVQATNAGTSNDHLDTAERESLETERDELQTRRNELHTRLVEANRHVAQAESSMDQTRGRAAIIKARMSLAEILNPFHENPELERLEGILADQRASLEGQVEQREQLLQELSRTDARREQIRRRLAGEEESLADSLSRRLAGLTESFSVEAIQARVESGTRAILNLMALFVMRTLVAPLILLWLGLKLFRAIYGIRPPIIQRPDRLPPPSH
ncbi:hypothetical protein [Halomonas huangheensis]|uniref:Uncharacterized protein n=1 Tax=Halomonas huangheensis TaxID=1178482 RepID=W1N6Q6_9GAMM|nr:hypothetical protein [Halomonas huangheensis]ALM52073.1 hypothetical protein AR456_07085 [Halomonas huangheensis]ERL50630.1 hypothetical protein BJB45_05730 [Halomonas huangheensis]